MNKVLALFIPGIIHTPQKRRRVPLKRLPVLVRQTIRKGQWHECVALLEQYVEKYGRFTSAYSKRAYTAFWYLHRRLISTFRVYGEYKLFYGDALDDTCCYNNDTFNPDAVQSKWVSRPYSDAPCLISEYYYQLWSEQERAVVLAATEGYPEGIDRDLLRRYERKRMIRNWEGLLEAMQSYGIGWVTELYEDTKDNEQYREIHETRESLDYGVLPPIIIHEEVEEVYEEVDDDWQYDV